MASRPHPPPPNYTLPDVQGCAARGILLCITMTSTDTHPSDVFFEEPLS